MPSVIRLEIVAEVAGESQCEPGASTSFSVPPAFPAVQVFLLVRDSGEHHTAEDHTGRRLHASPC